MKILFLTRYDTNGASSRMRTHQYLDLFRSAGWKGSVCPFFEADDLRERYRSGGYNPTKLLISYARRISVMLSAKDYDIVWIEKEALPWLPSSIELFLLKKANFVLDFDDAIFHNYDLHNSRIIRKLFSKKIDNLMKEAQLVIGGNRYLTQRALEAGAPRVEMIPTVIDLRRYKPAQIKDKDTTSIVWIGSPSTARYLEKISTALQRLSKKVPFKIRTIGSAIEIPGLSIENLEWSVETEALNIAECDIGVMPLTDTPWEKGKCAYKLVQYMACGLPTVSSPVGANLDVVIEGETGFFARNDDQWVERLETLILDRTLRREMGRKGRARVESTYCLQVTGPRLINVLSKVLST